MKRKTIRWICASSSGILVLAAFLGWRGSSVAARAHSAQMQDRLNTEMSLSQELISSRLLEFDTEVFNVVSAEYLQHASHTPGLSEELIDSRLSAIGVIELKTSGFEPDWWSLNPKAAGSISKELLQSMVPEWQTSIRQMGRHFFIRSLDLKQAPLMIALSRIELPGTQTSALAVSVFPPSALKLNSRSIRESLLWDQRGFIWGYRNSSYIGASLKSDPLVRASLENASEDSAQVQYSDEGKSWFGFFAQIPDSNLYIGISHPVPSVTGILFSWFGSLALGVFGAGLVGFAVQRLLIGTPEEPTVATETSAFPHPVFESRRLPDFDESLPESFEEPKPSRVHASAVPPVVQRQESPATSELPPAPPQQLTPETSVSLESVVLRAVGAFRKRCGDENVKITENLAAGLQVKAKAAQLQTAVEELIKNSLDAMTDVSTKELAIETTVAGANARLRISDTGVGIPEAIRDRIFEPFFTTKTDASRGLGLTVVKRLLELVKGDSEIWSEPGKGTRIDLTIPMPNVHVVEAPPAARPARDVAVDVDEFMAESVRDVGRKVEIRRPKVRMFD